MDTDIPNIFEAASNDDLPALEIALNHFSANSRDENQMTPLHHASASLAFNAARRLLKEHDLDRDARDKFGREAAIMAEDVFGLLHPDANKMCDLIWGEVIEDLEEVAPR